MGEREGELDDVVLSSLVCEYKHAHSLVVCSSKPRLYSTPQQRPLPGRNNTQGLNHVTGSLHRSYNSSFNRSNNKKTITYFPYLALLKKQLNNDR